MPIKASAGMPNDVCGDIKLLQTTHWADGTVSAEEIDHEHDGVACAVRDTSPNARQIEITYGMRDYGPQHSKINSIMEGSQSISVSYPLFGENIEQGIASSNSLSMQIASPTSITPAWGEQDNGFVVSLILEKDTYHVDSDILLHIACSRMTKGWQLSGGAFILGLCNPELEVRNADGTLVQLDDKQDIGNDNFQMCLDAGSSGSFVTKQIKKGEIVYKELTLNKDCVNQHFFVSRPGTYTIRAVWYARSENPNIQADVRSKPVTFKIIGKEP